ncbi:hypothetical protein BDW66DRAFT_147503 [Aspergillus desertorum]
MSSSIAAKCTVLIVGGGPGSAYMAPVLARDGIDTVVLEADTFLRYHIGESRLPSFRHYLKFIDLAGGVLTGTGLRRRGQLFSPPAAPTTTRESSSGLNPTSSCSGTRARAAPPASKASRSSTSSLPVATAAATALLTVMPTAPSPTPAAQGRRYNKALSSWMTFVDASGRTGSVNTKYLKNRRYSTALKNVADWAYYRNAGRYGDGTMRANSPFLEALHGTVRPPHPLASTAGVELLIGKQCRRKRLGLVHPLHDGTTPVGAVRNQTIPKEKKAAAVNAECTLTTPQARPDALAAPAPELHSHARHPPQVCVGLLLPRGAVQHPVYAHRRRRGVLHRPFLSSGVHLALTGALAAATTISASIRCDVDGETAG